MTSSTYLELRAVTKRYSSGGTTITVLQDVDFTVDCGEVVRVNGPSGSGKTTLINVAGLLTAPSSGEVVFDGTVLAGASDDVATARRSRDIGMVFQSHNLFHELDPVENVLMAIHPPRRQSDDRRTAIELLERAGLAKRLSTRAKKLSGGEQQRVAVVRALINRPSLLLTDEPISGLDDENRAFVLDEFARAAALGCAVVVSSHDDAVDRIATRHVHLRTGAIV